MEELNEYSEGSMEIPIEDSAWFDGRISRIEARNHLASSPDGVIYGVLANGDRDWLTYPNECDKQKYVSFQRLGF